MIKKIMTGLAVAAVSLMVSFSAPSLNQTTVTVEAAGKVLSMEEAAEKFIKTADEAYDRKEKITTSVTIKCPIKKSVTKNKRKLEKAIEKYKNKLAQVAAREKLAEFYDDDHLSYEVGEMLYPIYRAYVSDDEFLAQKAKYVISRGEFSYGGHVRYYKTSYKNGKLTLAVTYPGDIEDWRYHCDEVIYGKQNTEELCELVDGMSEVAKAWRIAAWLMNDHDTKYGGQSYKYISEKCVAENRAHGVCSYLHGLYLRYATRMGLTAFGISGKKENHEFSAVGIGDEIYLLDMQEVKVDQRNWELARSAGYVLEASDCEYLMSNRTLDRIEGLFGTGICIKDWEIVTDSEKYEKIYEEAVKNHQCPVFEDDGWSTDASWIYENEDEDFRESD